MRARASLGCGSWGTAFAWLLHDRGHEVVLACRDPEQARVIGETGRNPRYSTTADLRGIARHAVDDAPYADADVVVVVRPQPRLPRRRRGDPRRGADPEPDEGARSDHGSPAVGGRPRPRLRPPVRPEHGRGGRRRPADGRRDRVRGRGARARAAARDQLADLPALPQRRPARGRAVRGGEERDRARGRRRRRAPARRQREGGAHHPRARRDAATRGGRRRRLGHLRGHGRNGRPDRHVLASERPQPPRRRADRPRRHARARPRRRSDRSSRA